MVAEHRAGRVDDAARRSLLAAMLAAQEAGSEVMTDEQVWGVGFWGGGALVHWTWVDRVCVLRGVRRALCRPEHKESQIKKTHTKFKIRIPNQTQQNEPKNSKRSATSS
jgi:hypothetical protein